MLFRSGGGDTDEDEFEDGVEGGEDEDREFVTPEAERKFLTLSWWLLYMGWKDIGERVEGVWKRCLSNTANTKHQRTCID